MSIRTPAFQSDSCLTMARADSRDLQVRPSAGPVRSHQPGSAVPSVRAKYGLMSQLRFGLASLGGKMLLPLFRRMDAEKGRDLTLRSLRLADGLGLLPESRADDDILAISVLGQRFSNPIGLAAGLDKDAEALSPLVKLGFGFVEVGTITPRSQPGNPRPRLFRLEEDSAVINRMGFNSAGLEICVPRLRNRPNSAAVVGVNVGINKDNADPERDYPIMIAGVAPYIDYAVINVSSPNTPGLRDLQGEAQLRRILRAVSELRNVTAPVLVKIAPDLTLESLREIIRTCIEFEVKGLIISNTTISRPESLRSPTKKEVGGLSGRPLFSLSTGMLARAAKLSEGKLVLIGAGGVSSGEEALTKIQAGASLVQLYTAFAYSREGLNMIPKLKADLASALRKKGFTCVKDAVGTRTDELCDWY